MNDAGITYLGDGEIGIVQKIEGEVLLVQINEHAVELHLVETYCGK